VCRFWRSSPSGRSSSCSPCHLPVTGAPPHWCRTATKPVHLVSKRSMSSRPHLLVASPRIHPPSSPRPPRNNCSPHRQPPLPKCHYTPPFSMSCHFSALPPHPPGPVGATRLRDPLREDRALSGAPSSYRWSRHEARHRSMLDQPDGSWVAATGLLGHPVAGHEVFLAGPGQTAFSAASKAGFACALDRWLGFGPWRRR
jgi:hypothetical protein